MDKLNIHQLSEGELQDMYLPLRKEILQDELGWTMVPVKSPVELMDRYDEYSKQFGVFWNDQIIGGVRLIVTDYLAHLPSAFFLPTSELNWNGGSFAEISRLMVKRRFRHHGLMRLLIQYTLAVAKSGEIDNIIMSAAYRADLAGILSDIGFRLVRSGFSYHDSKIQPPVEAATFWLDSEHPYMLSSSDIQFHRIEDEVKSTSYSMSIDARITAEEYE